MPVKRNLAIKSSGLPSTITGPEQSGLLSIAGNVIAFYPEGTVVPTVDEKGEKLTSAYEVKDLDGYKLKKTQYITIGTEDAKNVITLDYGKPAKLNVKYVSEGGTEINKEEVQNGFVGEKYTVTPKAIEGYEFTKIANNSDPLTGNYADTEKNITLVYKLLEGTVPEPEVAGKLNIKYVDQNGQEIKKATDTTGFVGNSYEVVPDEIPNYEYVELSKKSAALKGLFTSAEQTIELVYQFPSGNVAEPVGSQIKINYLDKNGKELKISETISGFAGNSFAFTPDPIEYYKLTEESAATIPLTGRFTDENQVINLAYEFETGKIPEPVAGAPLNINFVDKNGQPIKQTETVTGFLGNGYEIAPEEIEHYQYQGILTGSAPLNGTFTDKEQSITFMYDFPTGVMPTPEVAGTLSIKYVSENGSEIKETETKTGFVGNGYQVASETLDGYSYQGLRGNSAQITGKLTKEDQEIVLVYKLAEGTVPEPEIAGAISLKYVDENGLEVKPGEQESGFVGNGYEITPDSIEGYTYLNLANQSAALTGSFGKEAKTITLVYQKNVVEPETPVVTTKPNDERDTGTGTVEQNLEEPEQNLTPEVEETNKNVATESELTPEGDAQVNSDSKNNQTVGTGNSVTDNSLPQTSEENSTWITALGLLLTGAISLATVIGFKKRKN